MRKDPKEYMKLAVEVMKKSIPERKKKDPSPYVGAVLVFLDGTVETTYRGEFREGDHAEYTLLDKKNRHRDLSGYWLFATLEPCAPGARNAPKISCAKRIVNARISDVWYGIEDKNPKVDHGGIDYLIDHGVSVHQFTPEFHKEIEEINKEFMKWANMKNDEEKAKKQKPQDILNQIAAASNDELSAFEIFREHKPISKADFAAQTSLPNRTAERLLKKFTDLNFIRKQGSGPKTNYIINE
ncbi:MAG: hypothetical protein HY738_08250 [Bacteroidia bacterium]|nr:hypothetical protein [Bacteroidia bacterium]